MTAIRIARAICLIGAFVTQVAVADVAATKHNLSATGPGRIKVLGADRVCIFCHTKHNLLPRAPAWSSVKSATNYIPYTSSTLIAAPGQPTGSSLLCLSCHDGTTALIDLKKPELMQSLRMAMRSITRTSSNLSTDLSDDHPVSLYYYDSYSGDPGEYVHPDSLPAQVELDSEGMVQCTSCHDAHEDKYGNFLRVDNRTGALCVSCHDKFGWDDSAHATADAPANSADGGRDSGSGCNLCHVSHSAKGKYRLLIYRVEENNCLYCHNGLGDAPNLEREFQKPYVHAVDDTVGVHDPAEPTVVEDRHVECTDCHNPHAAKTSDRRSRVTLEVDRDMAIGPLRGARGVSASGAVITAEQGVREEYEVCFRCHGDSLNRSEPMISRWLVETNTRIEFSPSNASFHPVIDRGKNLSVPSLIQPLTTNSTITCSDCHNNDSLDGLSGPHGSIYPALLERQYLTQDETIESYSAYAICYKCHSRNSILNNESFSLHRLHVTGAAASASANLVGTPCSTCHDPHGSEMERLINFDADIVEPTSDGMLEYFARGRLGGGCYLSCHGVEHNARCYDSKGATDC